MTEFRRKHHAERIAQAIMDKDAEMAAAARKKNQAASRQYEGVRLAYRIRGNTNGKFRELFGEEL